MVQHIKFDEEPDQRPPKRKAEEAFQGDRQKPERQISRTPGANRVVNFQDGENKHQAQNSTHKAHGTHTTGRNRLKERAQALSAVRQALPIHPHADEIRSKLRSHDVLLLVGETGSGKSTQVPQFLLDQNYTKRTPGKNGRGKVGGCIAITQPRRVAAISLARRVAEERGTPLGDSSPASQVGYSVRFDNSTSSSTRIKFLTDGMLLQELLRDPWLKEYSVVVVDEVHERGINVDLVMGFLKRIIEGRNEKDGRGGVPLKVVVMSATADMEKIEHFFAAEDEGAHGSSNGVHGNTEENGHEFQGFSDDRSSTKTPKKKTSDNSSIEKHPVRTTSCFIKGRQFPVKVEYTSQPVASAIDSALERVVQIHQHTPIPGDILVFLPGQETIDSLESLCNTYATNLTEQSKQKGAPRLPKLLVLPLFAALPTAAQQRVFEPTPPFTRKVILSTNIAETSVTVPGIRHVIDTGKRKARFFRPSLNLDTLLTKPISRSSAKQRAGRAGREAPGSCWRLYTEKTFYELEADTEPEILRCDLSQLVLTLKAHDVDDILSFPLLTRPPRKSLERALLHLLRLGALDRTSTNGQITSLGRRMSTLPLPAALARILLASAQPDFNCVDEIIDIVSGLSVENIWLPLHNRTTVPTPETPTITTNSNLDPDPASDSESSSRNPIELARRTLYRRSGDHLTLLAAMQAYAAENADRKSWCCRHGVSHRAMHAAADVRKQLAKLVRKDNTDVSPSSSADLETRILKCLLTGLRSNTARLGPSVSSSSSSGPSGPYTTHLTQKPLQIHPSSVLFGGGGGGQGGAGSGSRPPCIVFSEFVFTTRPYARWVSAVEEQWLDEES